MAELKTGSSKYNDHGLTKTDSEKPEFGYGGPLRYQRFMTEPLGVREIWLPSKAYKCNSTWWHTFTAPIIIRDDSVSSTETIKEFMETINKRFSPCKKIDLKGFGMQFPREYVIVMMEELYSMFPHEEVREHLEIGKKLLTNLEIDMGDRFIHPRRGVGLGYYANLMTMSVRIILGDIHIIKMFSDDMLPKKEDYPTAIANLNHFHMIVNDEKSGEEWNASPVLGGIQMLPSEGTAQFYGSYNSVFASVFTKRFHWERKEICQSLTPDIIIHMSRAYERIFGYEFYPGESMLNPENLGINYLAYPIEGYTDTYSVSQLKPPGPPRGAITTLLPLVEELPLRDRKEFHILRRRMWNWRSVKNDTIHKAIYPTSVDIETTSATLSVAARSTPMWSELLDIEYNFHSSGKLTRGELPSTAIKAVLENARSCDPYRSYATGGSIITTPYYIERPPDHESLVFATTVSLCDMSSDGEVIQLLHRPPPLQVAEWEFPLLFGTTAEEVADKPLPPIEEVVEEGGEEFLMPSLLELEGLVDNPVFEPSPSDCGEDLDNFVDLEYLDYL
jgi:hypothetical protein